MSDISKQCGKRITDNGNEKQNAALEETRVSQEPAYEIERGEKTAEQKVQEESLIETHFDSKMRCGP